MLTPLGRLVVTMSLILALLATLLYFFVITRHGQNILCQRGQICIAVSRLRRRPDRISPFAPVTMRCLSAPHPGDKCEEERSRFRRANLLEEVAHCGRIAGTSPSFPDAPFEGCLRDTLVANDRQLVEAAVGQIDAARERGVAHRAGGGVLERATATDTGRFGIERRGIGEQFSRAFTRRHRPPPLPHTRYCCLVCHASGLTWQVWGHFGQEWIARNGGEGSALESRWNGGIARCAARV